MTVLARWLTANWWRLLLVAGALLGAYVKLDRVEVQHEEMLHLLCVDHPKDSLCLQPLRP